MNNSDLSENMGDSFPGQSTALTVDDVNGVSRDYFRETIVEEILRSWQSQRKADS
jgi:hypothetical protein